MEPLTVIAAAKGIAQLTGLDTWIKSKLGDAVGDKAASAICDIAQTATGTTDPQAALELMKQDRAIANQVKQKLIDNKHQLTLAALEDVQSARTMYSHKNEMADHIARQVINLNLWAVVVLLLANGAVLHLVNDKAVALALGNLIGASINALWAERQQVIGFFFGSSLGSKIKTLINPVKKGGE